jgi:DhnA family fructose-bisphosphate aldolase class Ia
MNNAIVSAAAAKMTTPELHHIATALEADLIKAFETTNGNGTQAHFGMLEMLQACSAELVRRGGLGL